MLQPLSHNMNPAGRAWSVAAALAVLFAWEIIDGRNAEPPPAEVTEMAPQAASGLARNKAPIAALVAKTEDDARIVAARPLFAPSRRPALAAAAPKATPSTMTVPRLTGVIIAPDASVALFQPSGGKAIAAAKDGVIAGHVITSISPDGVVLSGPDGNRDLRVDFLRATPHVIHAQQEDAAD